MVVKACRLSGRALRRLGLRRSSVQLARSTVRPIIAGLQVTVPPPNLSKLTMTMGPFMDIEELLAEGEDEDEPR